MNFVNGEPIKNGFNWFFFHVSVYHTLCHSANVCSSIWMYMYCMFVCLTELECNFSIVDMWPHLLCGTHRHKPAQKKVGNGTNFPPQHCFVQIANFFCSLYTTNSERQKQVLQNGWWWYCIAPWMHTFPVILFTICSVYVSCIYTTVPMPANSIFIVGTLDWHIEPIPHTHTHT